MHSPRKSSVYYCVNNNELLLLWNSMHAKVTFVSETRSKISATRRLLVIFCREVRKVEPKTNFLLFICFHASFPPGALWITVIVSFVVLSQMTDYDQQDKWGQLIVEATHLTSTHARTHSQSRERVYLGSFRLWRPACSTGHRRCDPAGQVTRRLQASQMPAHNWILGILWCLRVKSNSFHSEAAHITSNPLKVRVGGHHCLVYICSKQENMQRFDSQKIRPLFKSAWVFFFFSLSLALFSLSLSHCKKTLEVSFCSPFTGAISMTRRSVWSCLFWERVLWVNLQCNQRVTVIYVMFSVTPDFYLNGQPRETIDYM